MRPTFRILPRPAEDVPGRWSSPSRVTDLPQRRLPGIRRTARRTTLPERGGFTLLEIILALAILAGALAALGEVMRLGDQNAARTRDETHAQILASSVMDEILSGVRPLTTVAGATFDLPTEPPWGYTIEITQSPDHLELLVIRVRVEQQLDPVLQPARFDLVRWVLNPEIAASASSASATTGGGGT